MGFWFKTYRIFNYKKNLLPLNKVQTT